jgi:RNA polymerase sigma-70 factor (ECF subfamily)
MGALDFLLKRTMISSNDDLILMRRIASGDEAALQELYATFGQRLYAYALRLTVDPATAEDVVQESLVAVWQGARRFRGDGRVLTWLLGIVHHKALNAIRGTRRWVDEPEEGAELPGGDPLPDEAFVQREQRRSVRAGLAQLSPEHRAVLELVFYQGLSLKEASEVCNCPVGTIKSRLNYAKSHLRGVLAREGLGEEGR